MFVADPRPQQDSMLLKLDISGRKAFCSLSINDLADHLLCPRHEVLFA